MYLKIIDFATYTSLKIGSALPVWVLEKNDKKAFCALKSSAIWDRLDNLTQARDLKKKPKINNECGKKLALKSKINLLDLAKNTSQNLPQNNTLPKNHTSKSNPNSNPNSSPIFTCIGNGYNLLISPNAKHLVMLSNDFDYILDLLDLAQANAQKHTIEVGAKTSSSSLFRFCKERDLGGLEFLRALPGSIGGLIKMNAGMKQYEIKNTLLEVCIDGVWRDDFRLDYRTSDIDGIISAARFSLKKGFDSSLVKQFQAMRKSHPKEPSCGSCFKNPSGDYAGRLLESVGLKGSQKNGIGFSAQHANFLVNLSTKDFKQNPKSNQTQHSTTNATNLASATKCTPSFADALAMIEQAQNLVKERFDIALIPEVRIVK